MAIAPSSLALAALLLAVLAAARAVRALTPDGIAAAAMVGAAVAAGGGPAGIAALLAFFVGASAVSRLVRGPSDTGGDAKGEERDAWQVLANGGAAALCGLAALAWPAALPGARRALVAAL
ncbi:MAG: DUF92 domain-containing protein, partial [Gemmatimonadales bacterium]|nr:DUF92 domain-containing protein [Gemmatimonadales bacterium]